MNLIASIPSPTHNGFSIGPLFFHAYGIAYVFAVAAAILISRWRWAHVGGDPDLPSEVAIWAFPGGLIGGRIYFDVTTPSQIPDHWWGVFAVWDGGLGIWGGIAGGALVGLWVVRRRLDRDQRRRFMDCVGPALLVSQAIGRIGNYFNQELFGAPSKLPWALRISPEHRPPGYLQYRAFEPTFLYELIWDLLLAAFLMWLGSKRRVRAPGLFALYVAGYSGFRIFEETQRIDYSNHFLGMRVNFWIASVLCFVALVTFVLIQRGTFGWGCSPAMPAPAGSVTGFARGGGFGRGQARTGSTASAAASGSGSASASASAARPAPGASSGKPRSGAPPPPPRRKRRR